MKLKLLLLLTGIGLSNLLNAQTTITIYPDDFMIEGYSTTLNSHNSTYPYFIATDWTVSGVEMWMKSYLRINLSSIPARATITRALLNLYSDGQHANGYLTGNSTDYKNNTCILKRTITQMSDASVTWSNQPSISPNSQVTLNNSTSNPQDYLGIDITQLIKDMISYPADGNLLEFSLVNYPTGKYSRMEFYSADYGTVSKRPMVQITYTTPPLIVNAGVAQTNCKGTSVMIGGSPTASGGCSAGYTYSWSPSTGLNATNIANPIATPTTTTTYTVTVTDAGGCGSATSSVVVGINALPAIYNVTSTNYCVNNTITNTTGVLKYVGLDGSQPGVNYIMYFDSGLTFGTTPGTGSAINLGLANQTNGIYKVKGISASTGCVSLMNGSVSVIVNPLLVADPGSPKSISCYGGSVTIGGNPTASGGSGSGYSYTWSPSTGLNNIHASNPIASPNANTTYTVTVTDANGCSSSSSVVVTYNPLTVSAGYETQMCPGDYVTLGDSPTAWGGAGGYHYSWSPAIGLSSTSESNPNATPSSTTTYSVTVTDANGCNASASVYIDVLPAPTANAGPDRNICLGSNTAIGGNPTVSGGRGNINISWDGPDGFYSEETNPVVNPTTTSTYNLWITDDYDNCWASASTQVIVNPLPTQFDVLGGGSFCSGEPGVPVDLSSSQNGTKYQLFNGSIAMGNPAVGTNSAITFGKQSESGNYSVRATSPMNCISLMNGNVPISKISSPVPFYLSGGGNYCNGGSGVALELSGSESGVTYQLYNGSTPIGDMRAGNGYLINFGNQTIPGTYLVKATNASSNAPVNCTTTMNGTPTISTNPLPQPFTVVGGGSYCSGGSGVPVNLNGSELGVTYQLYNDATPVGIAVAGSGSAISFGNQIAAGTYTVRATNAVTSCTNTMGGHANVSVSPLPVSNAGQEKVICLGSSTPIGGSPTASGGSGSEYIYSWSPATGLSSTNVANPVANPNTSTTYTVAVVDGNGCGSGNVSTVRVAVNQNTSITGQPLPLNIYEGNAASFGVTAAGSGTITYQWRKQGIQIPGAVSSTYFLSSVTPADTGNYDVVVNSDCGTVISNSVALTVYPKLLPPASLRAQSTSSSKVTLNWTDNCTDEDGFKIEQKIGTGNFAEIATVGANVSTYTVTNLTAGTSYTYRVSAYNTHGNSSYSDEVTVMVVSNAISINTIYLGDRYTYQVKGAVMDSTIIFQTGNINMVEIVKKQENSTLNEVLLDFTSKKDNEKFRLTLVVSESLEIQNVLINDNGNLVPLGTNFFSVKNSQLVLYSSQKYYASDVKLKGIKGITKIAGEDVVITGLENVPTAKLTIYNIKELDTPIRTISESLRWDGKDSNGILVVPGVYKLVISINDGSGKIINNQIIIK